MRPTDLTGQRFHRLEVVRKDITKHTGRVWWICKCDCGNTISTAGRYLTDGDTKSCGCLNTEKATERVYKHGMAHSTEYRSWSAMVQRCTNPNTVAYKNYGGRGISVYEPWRTSFEKFFEYMGPKPTSKHTLERIDNNVGYQPGNVMWATRTVQARNKRNSKQITFNSRTQTISQWAEEVGLSYACLQTRLYKGWSVADAMTYKKTTSRPNANHTIPH